MRHFLWLAVVCFGFVRAETGRDGWLRYAPVVVRPNSTFNIPLRIIVLNSTKSSPVYTAGLEVQKGLQGMLGRKLDVSSLQSNSTRSIVIGTVDEYTKQFGNISSWPMFEKDGFWVTTAGKSGSVKIIGQSERGTLYGAFAYLSMLAQGNFTRVTFASSPSAPIRWINQWDNLDGTIERGYSGTSIFFRNGTVIKDMTRVAEYARLLASVGINGLVVNNVNANPTLLTPENIEGLGRLADAARPYGVQLGISLNFASPKTLGGLTTYDPLDSSVIAWWNDVTDRLYSRVPDLAGYVIKANSEGQPGPINYNRTLAQGANLFARAVKPYGGTIMFRGFVYNNSLDASGKKHDRASAAVDFFKNLDGQFDDNVVVQIKYGPIDFQVREAISPMFANLRKTNIAIELQIVQEYLGQQSHLVYLAPLWKEVLDFDLRLDNKTSLVRNLATGKHFNRIGGWAAVANVGSNANWLGHDLAMSNLYAYGRMAWDPTAEPLSIIEDWTRLTFSPDHTVIDTVSQLSMASWQAYENYTGNLGLQTLTDVESSAHFGPNPASANDNGWGHWSHADTQYIGMDRTSKTGTGFAGQYPPEVARIYDDIETTPDDLSLWFHNVSFTHRLHSGQTVIQHLYDAHYNGASTIQSFKALWDSLAGKIDKERLDAVSFRLAFQAGHSIVWRDALCNFYYNLSRIPDENKRVGYHPWRVEAESMDLQGFAPIAVRPAETASNGTAVFVNVTANGTATHRFPFASGSYDVAVNYFDMAGELSVWRLFVSERQVLEWVSNNEQILGHAMTLQLNGNSATRITVHGVSIEKNDTIKLRAWPAGNDSARAAFDYISYLPSGVVD